MERPMRSQRQSGFTLIELIIVLAVLGILGAIVVPNLRAYRERAILAAAEEAGRQILNAFSLYAANSNGNCYPNQITTFDDVVRIAGENGTALNEKQRALFQDAGALAVPVDYICLQCTRTMPIECWQIPCPTSTSSAAVGPTNFLLQIPIQGIDRPVGSELYLRVHSVEGVSLQTGNAAP